MAVKIFESVEIYSRLDSYEDEKFLIYFLFKNLRDDSWEIRWKNKKIAISTLFLIIFIILFTFYYFYFRLIFVQKESSFKFFKIEQSVCYKLL